jgi:hypothetical protein
MYEDDEDIIILDDDEDLPRNAVVVRRRSNDHRAPSSSGRPRPVRVRSQPAVIQPVVRTTLQPSQPPEETKTDTSKLWNLAPDALRAIAAMTPMPNPPTAEDDVESNVKNLITYFGAIQTVAQRKEQLYALASIVERHV